MEWAIIGISLFINLVFFLYARWLIKIIKTKEDEFVRISEIISEYVSHVESVHEMEMFYGDKTLLALIEHGKALTDEVGDLDYIMYEGESDSLPSETEAEN
mgnify:FL=1|tara:strand:- start:6504 stop:6806 length:303 start_codon:yes stop_codon:yes gene_type:complete